MDRLVAAMSAIAGTLYFLAGALAWYRLCRPKSARTMHVRSIIIDRAIAWTSLAIIFFTVTVTKMGWYHWSDDVIDVIMLCALAAIFVCSLASIRAITKQHFGYDAVKGFALLSLAAGFIIFCSF